MIYPLRMFVTVRRLLFAVDEQVGTLKEEKAVVIPMRARSRHFSHVVTNAIDRESSRILARSRGEPWHLGVRAVRCL